MKILMQSRLDVFSNPGGDTIQILKTKEYLEKIGCEVTICCDFDVDLGKYNIVHLFNITAMHETYVQYLNAKRQNKPVVLSPVYQNFDELDLKASYGMKKLLLNMINKDTRELLKTILRTTHDSRQLMPALRQFLMGFTKQQNEVIAGSSRLLPNSHLEAQSILDDFKIKFDYDVVPYAVDSLFLNPDKSFVEKTGWQNYVLCVANYIERKNQLALIEAMRGLNIPLVLVGAVVPTQKYYYNKILSYAKKADFPIKIIEKITQNELIPLYSGAKVVALPSWIETCGMACLEGALAGCNIAITNRGYSKEYFKNMVYYCDPADIKSIRNSLLKTYELPANLKLKTHIMNHFTWEKTAEITKCAYEKVLSNV